jgi:TetR/AcrR family transcriptional regulator, cholesterol catabolism regulator
MAPSEKGTSRRGPVNGESRRSQLLGMAAELFATRGYSQTTVRDIADEAGILSGSLYHHFESKEAMLKEILEGFMGGMLGSFETVLAEDAPPREMLDDLIRVAFRTIHEAQDEVALYQNEVALFAQLPEFGFVGEASVRIEDMWRGVLERGREAGDFRDDLDISLTYSFIRDGVWSAVRWYRSGGRLQHGAVADQYLAMLHEGLLKR